MNVVELYCDGEIQMRVVKPKYITPAIKTGWTQNGYDKVVVKAKEQNGEAERVVVYNFKNGDWIVGSTNVTKLVRVGRQKRSVIYAQPDDVDLTAYHNQTQSDKTRVYVRYSDGSFKLFKPSDFDEDGKYKHLITGSVEQYRVIYFKTFHNKSKNIVRWNALYRDFIRIGDEFMHANLKGYSFKVDVEAIARNTIAPFPDNFLQCLPELNWASRNKSR